MNHKSYQFTTNINCGNCVSKVQPILEENENITEWTINTTHPQKILTISTQTLSPEEVIGLITKRGFKATLIASK